MPEAVRRTPYPGHGRLLVNIPIPPTSTSTSLSSCCLGPSLLPHISAPSFGFGLSRPVCFLRCDRLRASTPSYFSSHWAPPPSLSPTPSSRIADTSRPRRRLRFRLALLPDPSPRDVYSYPNRRPPALLPQQSWCKPPAASWAVLSTPRPSTRNRAALVRLELESRLAQHANTPLGGGSFGKVYKG
jgi:hypothetical protein